MLNLFDFNVVYEDIISIARFIPVTLGLAFGSGVAGLILGFLIALVEIKKIPVIHQLVSVFISFMRGTPVIVQLYVTYFGIPIMLKYFNYYNGTNIKIAGIPPVVYAMTALALNSAAFLSIVIKTSFESVSEGEIEAARALGMTGVQVMRRVILPCSLDVAVPNMGNQFIGLIKGTSLAFTCAVVEMTAEGKIVGAAGYRYFEAYVALAILYWVITIVVEQIIRIIMHFVKVPETIDDEQKKGLSEA